MTKKQQLKSSTAFPETTLHQCIKHYLCSLVSQILSSSPSLCHQMGSQQHVYSSIQIRERVENSKSKVIKQRVNAPKQVDVRQSDTLLNIYFLSTDFRTV